VAESSEDASLSPLYIGEKTMTARCPVGRPAGDRGKTTMLWEIVRIRRKEVIDAIMPVNLFAIATRVRPDSLSICKSEEVEVGFTSLPLIACFSVREADRAQTSQDKQSESW
jgi:hypothetical protein